MCWKEFMRHAVKFIPLPGAVKFSTAPPRSAPSAAAFIHAGASKHLLLYVGSSYKGSYGPDVWKLACALMFRALLDDITVLQTLPAIPSIRLACLRQFGRNFGTSQASLFRCSPPNQRRSAPCRITDSISRAPI